MKKIAILISICIVAVGCFFVFQDKQFSRNIFGFLKTESSDVYTLSEKIGIPTDSLPVYSKIYNVTQADSDTLNQVVDTINSDEYVNTNYIDCVYCAFIRGDITNDDIDDIVFSPDYDEFASPEEFSQPIIILQGIGNNQYKILDVSGNTGIIARSLGVAGSFDLSISEDNKFHITIQQGGCLYDYYDYSFMYNKTSNSFEGLEYSVQTVDQCGKLKPVIGEKIIKFLNNQSFDTWSQELFQI